MRNAIHQADALQAMPTTTGYYAECRPGVQRIGRQIATSMRQAATRALRSAPECHPCMGWGSRATPPQSKPIAPTGGVRQKRSDTTSAPCRTSPMTADAAPVCARRPNTGEHNATLRSGVLVSPALGWDAQECQDATGHAVVVAPSGRWHRLTYIKAGAHNDTGESGDGTCIAQVKHDGQTTSAPGIVGQRCPQGDTFCRRWQCTRAHPATAAPLAAAPEGMRPTCTERRSPKFGGSAKPSRPCANKGFIDTNNSWSSLCPVRAPKPHLRKHLGATPQSMTEGPRPPQAIPCAIASHRVWRP